MPVLLPVSVLAFTAITFMASTFASAGDLTGRVVSAETGQPLAGANGVIVGTAFAAQSDEDGNLLFVRAATVVVPAAGCCC